MSENKNETVMPTKEEMIKFFNEQIDLKKVQLQLQLINADMAEARARELKALEFIGQMTNPQQQGVPHEITQEDLDANPELKEAGLKVGDEVLIPGNPLADEKKVTSSKKSLKKDKI